MAETTALALPGKLQMINGDGKFSSETASFVNDQRNYSVISIIGPQSSGKSYLLNNLFEAEFDVLNATEGRKQTTKGIWIARCINPGMIIMDVEGFDGKERGQDDKLFERQSALFSLIVSDILLLNMWFHDIGRQDGANIPLIELIFKERVKIEATKTTIIFVGRDHDYDETSPNVTREQLEKLVNEIWRKVHPDKKMGDYVEVIVKDFPHKSHKGEFAQKCIDLSNFLCSFAANENLEEENYGSGFAVSSEQIWDHIRSNKELVAADHKVARSKYFCKKTVKSLVRSLDQDKMGEWMNNVTISVKEFTAGFSMAHDVILTKYEAETASLMISVRNEKKAKLEEILRERFRTEFCSRLLYLTSEILEKAESNLKPQLKNLKNLDNSTIIEVIKPYLKTFDDNIPTAADLLWKDDVTRLVEFRAEFVAKLTELAEKKASRIKLKRGLKRVGIAAGLGITGATTFTLGTAWAMLTLDPSLMIAGATICASI